MKLNVDYELHRLRTFEWKNPGGNSTIFTKHDAQKAEVAVSTLERMSTIGEEWRRADHWQTKAKATMKGSGTKREASEHGGFMAPAPNNGHRNGLAACCASAERRLRTPKRTPKRLSLQRGPCQSSEIRVVSSDVVS